MIKSKRDFLKASLGGIALGVVGQANAVTCNSLTASQPEGPFYPENDQMDKDNDLTWVKGGTQRADGEVIQIVGKVLGANCQPVEGVLVEIWQACHTGKYNHSADPNTADLDPNFQYWGRAITNEAGEYEFTTILPGAYPAASDWVRPAHIHCKVQKRGFHELTTQMYFKGSDHLNADRLYRSIPELERGSVVMELVTKEGSDTKVGEFDIKIEKIK